MKKIAIIGKFHTDKGIVDGQAIKTTILASEVEHMLGQQNVIRMNTFGWKQHPLKLFARSVNATMKCSDVILMTDAGGIKVFPWLLLLANIRKRCKLHYAVVGGWLVHFLKEHRLLAACLRRFDAIYVETNAMKKGLEMLGFQNLYILRNCKPLSPLAETELFTCVKEPYRLCIFSRIMREKGIEEAVNAVAAANEYYGRTVFSLDIYGQVDDGQISWFEKLTEAFPPEIRYCGIASFEKSVEILKPYFALLFPTKFYTEGIPGTIIDAYAAGVPVIASEWENFSDMVENGITGIGYPFTQTGQLKEILIEVVKEPSKILSMKKHCLEKAQEYLPENALKILWEVLFSGEDGCNPQ